MIIKKSLETFFHDFIKSLRKVYWKFPATILKMILKENFEKILLCFEISLLKVSSDFIDDDYKRNL